MKPKYYIEVKVNGEVIVDKLLKLDKYDNYAAYEKIISDYKINGYEHVESSSSGYTILANHKEKKSVYISYRLYITATDSNGNKIYENSILKKLYSGMVKMINPKYNSWYLSFTEDQICLVELTGYARWGDANYTYHKVESLDIFKDFEVINPS